MASCCRVAVTILAGKAMTNSLAVRSVLTLVPAPGPTDVNLTDSAATDWNNADDGENGLS
ncbi:hypothetical protein F444_13511 [Phytophthora nicotianae P1976]|uniref:Uncharacterized protein n=1 Tax=Phytophthora nicotianae P1976 TaxID=1317066 RepID=A0A080ZTM9_PHYNI|nr:hypothetical protein F444_13511 [Phytophthora nicotianae P1976]